MNRSLTPFLIAGLLMFMAACNSPRKACRKADKLVAKAVYTCPEIMRAHTDTVYVQLPGDTLVVEVPWTDTVAVDSLLSACDSLRAAAEAIALNSLNQGERLKEQVQRAQRTQAALALIRQQACRVEPLEEERTDYSLYVYQDKFGRLRASVHVRPKTIPCPNNTVQVNPGNAVVTGVSSWWRVVAIVASLLLLVCLVALRWLYGTLKPEQP